MTGCCYGVLSRLGAEFYGGMLPQEARPCQHNFASD
jgi:hypothetical protein